MTAGTVLVNGFPADAHFVRSQSAYVLQSDNVIPTLTVQEVLSFYSRTVLPAHYSREAREKRLEGVMESMGLSCQA